MRPGKFSPIDALSLQSLVHADMIIADTAPIDQHRASRQTQEPIKHRQRSIGDGHVRQRGKGDLDEYRHPGDTVSGDTEEDFRSLVFESQTV